MNAHQFAAKRQNFSDAVGSNLHGRLNGCAGRTPHFTPNPTRIADNILSANELSSLDLNRISRDTSSKKGTPFD
jgi:hypothetical protein